MFTFRDQNYYTKIKQNLKNNIYRIDFKVRR